MLGNVHKRWDTERVKPSLQASVYSGDCVITDVQMPFTDTFVHGPHAVQRVLP